MTDLTEREVAERHDAAARVRWIVSEDGSELMVSRCLACYEHPGSTHGDGSGVCKACGGSGWHVLAMAADPLPNSPEEER